MSGNEYVSELRAERDRLREVVARVERLAAEWEDDVVGVGWDEHANGKAEAASLIRDAISAPSPSAERPYTETDGPAPAGPYAATEGAGDGV